MVPACTLYNIMQNIRMNTVYRVHVHLEYYRYINYTVHYTKYNIIYDVDVTAKWRKRMRQSDRERQSERKSE